MNNAQPNPTNWTDPDKNHLVREAGHSDSTQREDIQREALTHALEGQSTLNYQAIIDGLMAKGIDRADIKPRENVFTRSAWGWLGRRVKLTEQGIKVVTYVPWMIRDRNTGQRKTALMPRTTQVFHISQTERVKKGDNNPPEAGHD
jgi:hypothetical protein